MPTVLDTRQFVLNLVYDENTLSYVPEPYVASGSGPSSDVNVLNFPATQPISAASLPLPTGAATQATLGTLSTDIADVKDTVNSAITGTHPVLDVRAVLFATNPGGTYGNIERTSGGNLKVAVEEFDASLPAGTNHLGSVTESRPATSSVTSVASSASSVTLLASNTNRRVATIYNDSTQVLYVKFGATASSSSFTVKMAADSYYEFPQPCYTGVVDGIWASANGSARLTEVT